MATTAAMNNKEKHAVHRLKRANVWGKFKVREAYSITSVGGESFDGRARNIL